MSQDRQPTVDLVGALQARIAAGNLSVQNALWILLERRRGEAFCARCLREMLGTGPRIHRVLVLAEGRSAVRRYAPCSRCGEDRLLCGLPA